MEKTYWLGRQRASAAMARKARCSQSRLVHFDLAGRYSVKAANSAGRESMVVGPTAAVQVLQPGVADATYYAELEEGARFLASRSTGETERNRHLSMANRYVKLRLGVDGGAL